MILEIFKYDEESFDDYKPFDLLMNFVDTRFDNLVITEDDEYSFMDLLNNKKIFLECMKEDLESKKDYYYNFEDDLEGYEEVVKSWNYYLDNFDNLLDKAEAIEIHCSTDELLEYLNKYEILKNKKIIISEYFDLSDSNKILEISKKFEGYNVYINLSGNREAISIETALKTIKKIKKQAQALKKLNLSQLETIMVAYDVVRDRVYKSEKEDDKLTESRDLSKILFSDTIVCAGFAEMFYSILNELNYNIFYVHLEDKKNMEAGHARNAIKIDDDKYNVHGYYYFDTTWDSKRNKDDKSFLERYLFFAKTRDEIEEIEHKNNIYYIYKGTDYYSKKIINNLEKSIKEKDDISYFKYISTINNISRLTEGKNVSKEFLFNLEKDEINNIIEKSKEVIKNFNKPISAETMIDLVVNVRNVEKDYDYKYSYYPQTIFDICRKSGWKFKESTGDYKKDFVEYFMKKGYFEKILCDNIFRNQQSDNKKIKKI